MRGIGGNTTATVQTASVTPNDIGEAVKTWTNAKTLRGWLDLLSGDSRYTAYAAKVQESTHVFVCDYTPLPSGIRAENSRLIVDGKTYDITLIDNPMGMGYGSQWEIYLRFTGG